MAEGLCLDCNFDGRLGPQGECPRCGSDWVAPHSVELHDEDQLADLFAAPGRLDLDGEVDDRYEL